MLGSIRRGMCKPMKEEAIQGTGIGTRISAGFSNGSQRYRVRSWRLESAYSEQGPVAAFVNTVQFSDGSLDAIHLVLYHLYCESICLYARRVATLHTHFVRGCALHPALPTVPSSGIKKRKLVPQDRRQASADHRTSSHYMAPCSEGRAAQTCIAKYK